MACKCAECIETGCRLNRLSSVSEMTNEEKLAATLKQVLMAWKEDADMGDGLEESKLPLFNRALKLCDKDSPSISFSHKPGHDIY